MDTSHLLPPPSPGPTNTPTPGCTMHPPPGTPPGLTAHLLPPPPGPTNTPTPSCTVTPPPADDPANPPPTSDSDLGPLFAMVNGLWLAKQRKLA